MVKADNPAGRLHAILTRAKGQPVHETYRVAWAKTFGIDPNNLELVLDHLLRMHRLMAETKRLLKIVAVEDLELYMDSFPAIEQVLVIDHLAAQWGDAYRKLQEKSTLLGLAFCSSKLSSHFGEDEIQHEDLREFINSIAELRKEAENLDTVSEDLRQVIIDSLSKLDAAIRAHRSWGAESVLREVEAAYGAVFRRYVEFSERLETVPILKNFRNLLKTIDTKFTEASRIKGMVVQSLESVGSVFPLITAGDRTND